MKLRRNAKLDLLRDIEESVVLVASAAGVQAHPRENREVDLRALDPALGADGELWNAVVELRARPVPGGGHRAAPPSALSGSSVYPGIQPSRYRLGWRSGNRA